MKSAFASLSAALVAAFLLAGCATAPANQDPILTMRQGDTTITLLPAACPKDGIIAQLIGPDYIGTFKEAIVLFKGKTIKACWSALDSEFIGIIDEQGDSGMIPQDMFSKTGGGMPKAKPDDWRHNA